MQLKPEIVAPAGSFMAGWYAFEAGADAVYVGLKRFSARASAQNFSFQELDKLKNIALKQKRKVYVTVNTIIKENETDDLIEALCQCEQLGIDALIVQDPGVMQMMREYFPDLVMHASTQTALGDGVGVAEALSLGIRRIVLPRELAVPQIENLRADFPAMQFEVFIHGALCYSYSGLCLASGLLVGRSGNRGRCVQPCRWRFRSEDGREGHFLSCRDLYSGVQVQRLVVAGIDALKIEGRLKPPSYVFHTVRLYRLLIDDPNAEKNPDYSALLEKCGSVFSRERTRGRLFGEPDGQILTRDYTRAAGHRVGRVEERAAEMFSFQSESDLCLGDVLQFFLSDTDTTPYKLPLRSLRVNGQETSQAVRGDWVTVESLKVPAVGQKISRVYSRRLELPGISHHGYKTRKLAIPVRITFSFDNGDRVKIEAPVEYRLPVYTHPVFYQKMVTQAEAMAQVKAAFARAESTSLRISVEAIVFSGSKLTVNRLPGNPQLRKVKEDYLRFIEGHLQSKTEKRMESIRTSHNEVLGRFFTKDISSLRGMVQNRENLNPVNLPDNLIPFYSGGCLSVERLAQSDNTCFLPLLPVPPTPSSEYYDEIRCFVSNNPSLRIFLGLNNVGQTGFVRDLENHPHVFSFIDFFCYLANSFAIRLAREQLCKLCFGYFWIEGSDNDRAALREKTAFPLFSVGHTFRPPLFLHAGDFYRETTGEMPVPDSPRADKRFNNTKFRFEARFANGYSFIFPVKA